MSKKLNEPVLVGHYVAALIGVAATFLVSHGVITGHQASSLVQSLAPAATGVALTALGWVTRRYVSPAWKVAEAEASRVGLNISALPQAVEDIFPDWSAEDLAAATAES